MARFQAVEKNRIKVKAFRSFVERCLDRMVATDQDPVVDAGIPELCLFEDLQNVLRHCGELEFRHGACIEVKGNDTIID